MSSDQDILNQVTTNTFPGLDNETPETGIVYVDDLTEEIESNGLLEDLKSDTHTVRDQLINQLRVMNEVFKESANSAINSNQPREIESFAALSKVMIEGTERLMKLHKEVRDIVGKDIKNASDLKKLNEPDANKAANQMTKSVIVMSAEDLLKLSEKNDEEIADFLEGESE